MPALGEPQKLASIEREIQIKTNVPADKPRYSVEEHRVASGDSVFAIAESYKVKPETVLWANYDVLQDDPHSLAPGMVLKIPPTDGIYYQWKENDLHYYSPAMKKSYGMQPMTDVLNNKVWKDKPSQGIALFGIGNEPFWSVEVNRQDSLVFQLSDWDRPLRLKIASFTAGRDSSIYLAQNDSVTVRLLVYPFFCSDGMSDHVYKNRIRKSSPSVLSHNKSVHQAWIANCKLSTPSISLNPFLH